MIIKPLPTTPDLSYLDTASVAELIALVKQLLARVAAQDLEIADLKEQLRESKRAKAPFSKGRRVASPKSPGRKAGIGTFSSRPAPVPSAADVVIDLSAPLAATDCPQCSAPLEIALECGTVEDTPPQPQRIIKRFRIEVGVCPVCGWRGRGAHAELPAGQHGATAHRIGPRVLAQALTLHYQHGLPLCKVPAVILSNTGIRISQSALTQAAGTLCAEGGPVQVIYQKLRQAVRKAKVVNTDDTGWRINGVLAFLMGFFTPFLAVYQVRWRHRHEEVLEMLGVAFRGLLGTDRGVSYEARALDDIRQQKCLSHLLKNLSAVEEKCRGRGKEFARKVKAILREAIMLWQEYRAGKCDAAAYAAQGKRIRERLSEALQDRVLSDANNQRLLDGIGYQHDCGRVLLFLEHPEIEPTNNRAERGLRPAVIARKVSHCSKNEHGARIYEAMKSVTATLALRGQDVASALADIIIGKPMPKAPVR